MGRFQEMYGERGRVTVPVGSGRGAKQSFKEECDINAIMRRYQKTGQLPLGQRMPSYGHYVGPTELLDAYELVKMAEAQFAALPSGVRERFKNRPGEFLAFVQDEKNAKEARELGLLAEEPVPRLDEARLKKIADDAAAAVVAASKPPAT